MPTLDMEAVKTALAVCGTYLVTYWIMRVILWLDTGRRAEK